MTIAACVWTVAGLLTGGVHSAGIYHSASHPRSWMAATGMLRLLIVGGVLTISSINGFVLPTAAGWILGFFTIIILFFLTKR